MQPTVRCILRRSDRRLDNLEPPIYNAYFSALNVNVKTDSGADGRSASVLQHSRWEVSASRPHIHSALHSSCKSKVRLSFFSVFLSSSRLLNLASLIVGSGSTSHSLINYLNKHTALKYRTFSWYFIVSVLRC